VHGKPAVCRHIAALCRPPPAAHDHRRRFAMRPTRALARRAGGRCSQAAWSPRCMGRCCWTRSRTRSWCVLAIPVDAVREGKEQWLSPLVVCPASGARSMAGANGIMRRWRSTHLRWRGPPLTVAGKALPNACRHGVPQQAAGLRPRPPHTVCLRLLHAECIPCAPMRLSSL
jgi:hypothetical protein